MESNEVEWNLISSKIKVSPPIWRFPCKHTYILEGGVIRTETGITKTISKALIETFREAYRRSPPALVEFDAEIRQLGFTLMVMNPFKPKEHIVLKKVHKGFASAMELRTTEVAATKLFNKFNKYLKHYNDAPKNPKNYIR